MQKGVILTYKSLKRQFFISSTTKPHIINTLIRRAFHLTSDVKQLRHPRGHLINMAEVFQLKNGRYFQILTEDDISEKSRSENYSQKNMAKSSGRKYPPLQKELLDSKFFVEDFQLFMSDAANKKQNLYGIIFFSNKRKAQFLGKKLLRELVFQFDQIQFFYTLHPIKLHSTSTILGEMLLFTIFRGNKMIFQRQFTENVSAADEIFSYIKALINNGQLKMKQKVQTKPKNLIYVHEQRSFDGKIEPLSGTQKGQQQQIQKLDLFKMKSMVPGISVPDKNTNQPKVQSPLKGNLLNQISFENEFQQPNWFFEGNALTRLQKAFLSALLKNKDQNLISFCNGLDLKNQKKQQLNIKLLKTVLREFIDERFQSIPEDVKFNIEMNQQNRHSPVFSSLLQLAKFGNINLFVESISKILPQTKKQQISYLNIARQIHKAHSTFQIKLRDCDDQDMQDTEKRGTKIIGKHEQFHQLNNKIANSFHRTPPEFYRPAQKNIKLPKDFTQAQRAMITDRIIKFDAFLLQNYVPRKSSQKKFVVFSVDLVRKYLSEIEDRYKILSELTLDPYLRIKLHKLSTFSSLLYFLYKQRYINKKQQKAFIYLYIWSDLNMLAAYELYLTNRNLDEFTETIYSIDYTYYLQRRYGVEMTEAQNFTMEIELQFVFMMLFGQYIIDFHEKVAIQKFIRAGDCTILSIIKQNHKSKESIIEKVRAFGKEKKNQLEQIAKRQIDESARLKQIIQQRKNMAEQIISAHFRAFKKTNKTCRVQECIEKLQPLVTSIFQMYESSNDLMEFLESFELYIGNIDRKHLQCIMRSQCEELGIDYKKFQFVRADIVKGIYDLYLYSSDVDDLKDSIARAYNKMIEKEQC